MSLAVDSSRRRGGRDARRALRAQPIPREEAAVKPGMLGGQYRPLDDAGMERIHETAMELLETVGFADAIPSCVELLTSKGCWTSDAGRLCVPRALVEETLKICGRDFILYGRDRKHDLRPSGNRAYFGTGGAAVHIAVLETNEYRESYLDDLYDCARLVDQCEHIHYFQRPLTARDMEDPHDLDINTLYASIAGTSTLR